ncbi:guanylate kinase [Microvenator marinus]|uniref:Guanylate kinase n=1 Tax=Microvenator marinus TaxID=2600177 RepID=A0A5B8XNX4_9DELT|nr:guanylate kinase [Microvenator marinus]QED25723.1 guanylate kinase [Microvenator marinus]
MIESDEGLLFIVCGPSGVGKTTLCRELLEQRPRLSLSISYTTRSPRGDEKDGVAYHFVNESRFQEMIDQELFAEWARVHGHSYGTSVEVIEDAWSKGRDILFDIDYQGAGQLRARFGKRAVLTLVVPPSMGILEKRLRGRGTDSAEVVDRRLQAARHELSQFPMFDYVIVNDDLAHAQAMIFSIYDSSRHMRLIWEERMRSLLSL